jgi:hypothetical protein
MIYLYTVSFILESLHNNLTLEKQSINAEISQKSQIQLRQGAIKKTQNPILSITAKSTHFCHDKQNGDFPFIYIWFVDFLIY